MKITIEFEQEKLDGTAAAQLVLAVKRCMGADTPRATITAGCISGPIVDEDGTVLGQWKAENTNRRKAA